MAMQIKLIVVAVVAVVIVVRFVAKFNCKAVAKTNTTQLALTFLIKTAPTIKLRN